MAKPENSDTSTAAENAPKRTKSRFKSKKDDISAIALPVLPEERICSYGKYVGEEVEHLSPEMAIFCKKVINDAIFLAQMGKLSEYSHIVTDNPAKNTNCVIAKPSKPIVVCQSTASCPQTSTSNRRHVDNTCHPTK